MMNIDIKKAIPVQWLLDNGVEINHADRITDGEFTTRYTLDPKYKEWAVFQFCSRSHCNSIGNNYSYWKPNFKKLYYQYSAEVLEVKAQQERLKERKAQKIKGEIYKIVDCNLSSNEVVEKIILLFMSNGCIGVNPVIMGGFRLSIQMRLMKLNNQIKTLENLYDAKEINHYSFKRNSDFYREVFSNDIYKIRPGGDV